METIPPFPVPPPVPESILPIPFDWAKAMPPVSWQKGRLVGVGPWLRWFAGSGGPLAFLLRFYAGTIRLNARKLQALLWTVPALCGWMGWLSRFGFRCDMKCLAQKAKTTWTELKAIDWRGEWGAWICRWRWKLSAGRQLIAQVAEAVDPRWWLIGGRLGVVRLGRAIRSWPGILGNAGRFCLAWGVDLALQVWQCGCAGWSWMRETQWISRPRPAKRSPDSSGVSAPGIWAGIIAVQREQIGRSFAGWSGLAKQAFGRALLREAIREQMQAGGEALRNGWFWFRQLKGLAGKARSAVLESPANAVARSRPAPLPACALVWDRSPRLKRRTQAGEPAVPPWTWNLYRLTQVGLLPVMVAACLGTSLVIGECFIRLEAFNQRRANKQYVAFQMARNGHVLSATERVTYRLTDRSASAFLDIGQTEKMMGELRRQYGAAGGAPGDENAVE